MHTNKNEAIFLNREFSLTALMMESRFVATIDADTQRMVNMTIIVMRERERKKKEEKMVPKSVQESRCVHNRVIMSCTQ